MKKKEIEKKAFQTYKNEISYEMTDWTAFLVVIMIFSIGYLLGLFIGEDCTKPNEIIIEEPLQFKAENCTSTGFVPETPFNEDYFNCEVSK